MKFRVGQLSITGRFRDNNEDNLYCDSKQRFVLVADGMGGQSAGEKASALAMEIIPRRLNGCDFEKLTAEQATKAIDEAVAAANSEIIALGELDARWHQMGTTLTYLLNLGSKVLVGGLGDSRTYLLRNGLLQQLTTDHSLTQALVDAGTLTPEEAATHRYRNVLYRYLGTKEGGTGTNPKSLEPQAGDKYLLCTDGVTGGATDSVLRELLLKATDPTAAAEAIVKAAEDGGSKDNITAVVLFVDA